MSALFANVGDPVTFAHVTVKYPVFSTSELIAKIANVDESLFA
jgi:hypothetical protein